MDYHPPVDGALLPRFQAWKTGLSPGGAQVQDVRLWNYLYHEATADLAVAFATLFWPDFVEIDGYVLLAEHFRPANFADWLVWQHEKEAASWQVEAVLNEVHL